eukprot:424005-Hanusia_phi.AAC.1
MTYEGAQETGSRREEAMESGLGLRRSAGRGSREQKQVKKLKKTRRDGLLGAQSNRAGGKQGGR